MFKNKLFIFTLINYIIFFIFKNARFFNIGGYDVYRLSYIIPLYYNYLVMPIIVSLIIIYYIYKFFKKGYSKNELIILLMNITIVLLHIGDRKNIL